MKKGYCAKLYAEDKVTLNGVAMDAHVSVCEMMEYLKDKKMLAQYDVKN